MFGGSDTYMSVEFREGVDHIKPMHVHYGGVDDELGSVGDKGQGEKQMGTKLNTVRGGPCSLHYVASAELTRG